LDVELKAVNEDGGQKSLAQEIWRN